MSNTSEKFKSDSRELEALIELAVKKIEAKKENDICRYLPYHTGGYIHHFTMRKMKQENPGQLMEWIKKYILNSPKPQKVPPKSRAARGSRKRRDQLVFTKDDIERMLNMARITGDKEMIRKLTPRKELRQIKRELQASIRQNRVEQELWNSYVEAVAVVNSQTAAAESVRLAN